jgi:hypothetical protein
MPAMSNRPAAVWKAENALDVARDLQVVVETLLLGRLKSR